MVAMNILNFVKPKDHKQGMYLETITPVMAIRMLEKNKLNRPMRDPHIRSMGKDMRAGNWRVTGDCIKFDKDGNILDGQQRLRAISLVGTAIETYVVYGIDPAAKTVMDTGKVRTASDVLAFDGVIPRIAKIVGPTISWIFRYQSIVTKGKYSSAYTNAEALEFFRNNTELADFADLISGWPKNRRPISASTLTFIFFEIARFDDVLGLDFIEKLCTGARMEETEPVYHARNFLEDDLRATTKMSEKQRIALVIKAWNRTRKGDRIAVRARHSIKWKGGEAFPQFK